jgi:integrase
VQEQRARVVSAAGGLRPSRWAFELVVGRGLDHFLAGFLDPGERPDAPADALTRRVRNPLTISRRGKADRDQQMFAMTPRCQEMLTERQSLGAEAFVFGREDGAFVASFDKTWKRLFTLAGLSASRKHGFVWHDLRHEDGSYLVEQDATIQEVKELMRHADIRTTARYLTANEDRLRELARRMEQRVG